MRHLTTSSLVIVIIMSASFPSWAEWSDTLKQYECIEIEKFKVDQDDVSSVKAERAATMSKETLESLQHKILGQIVRGKLVPKVTKADQSPCHGSQVLVFGGRVTDYKKGSRAARLLIGLGAGKQKFEVQAFLKDKRSGKILAEKKIVDRKMGGFAGGDEEKGERDFAEKAARFVTSGK